MKGPTKPAPATLPRLKPNMTSFVDSTSHVLSQNQHGGTLLTREPKKLSDSQNSGIGLIAQ